jgi:phosphatidate cytidylyltransferase
LSNFILRALTGTLFVAIIIASIIWNEYYFFSILFLLVTVLSLLEFYKLAASDGIKAQKYMGIFVAVLLFLIVLPLPDHRVSVLMSILLPGIFSIFIIELYRKQDKPFNNIAFTLLGIIYIALPFTLLHKIILGAGGTNIVLGYFFILWTNDTTAYLVGKNFGKRKLFERISPKKTWEGSIGGGVLSLGVAYMMAQYFHELKLQEWLIIGVIIIVTGTLGDLVESLFKRSINSKDSGTILPGHGGLLDRFDGLFVSIPFIWTYIHLFT